MNIISDQLASQLKIIDVGPLDSFHSIREYMSTRRQQHFTEGPPMCEAAVRRRVSE